MPEQVTLSQVAATYLGGLNPESRQQSQQELNRFLRWFGGERPLTRLTPPEVASYAESLAAAGGDFQQRLEPVRALLSYAKKEGLTPSNLSIHLRVKKQAQSSNKVHRPQPREIRLTEVGRDKLSTELERLRSERPRVAEELHRAAADKDFRENAPLDAAREHQGHMEARIRELEAILSAASLTQRPDHQKADLGSTLVLFDLTAQEEVHYTLVHASEVSLAQGKISTASPLGKALLGRESGDTVEIVAPAGTRHYRIESVTH